jgi:outer membrane protein assembly factor BamD (BamD/ComL family)
VRLYPGDSREQEAKFLSLTALYNYSKSIAVECDSSETNNVISMCKKLLNDEGMSNKNEQIAAILKHCQERLINKDVAVFESYVRRDKLEAAATRLAKIKDAYNEQAQELAPRIAYLECKLASAANNDAKARECLELLEDQYAESKYAKMAASYVGNNSGNFFS